jgi:hypothetical protein
MSTDGYPYEGSDPRVLGKFGAWIQRLATFKSSLPPLSITFELLGVRLNVPIGRDRYLCLRAHIWRWDAYNRAYIFMSCMAKRVPATAVMP